MSKNTIVFWNRQEKKEQVEQVYGDAALQWVYGTSFGQVLAEKVLTRPEVSQLYGRFQSSRLSRKKIQPFIRNFKIPMHEFVDEDYASFNDFFIRRFKDGVRVFAQGSEMAAFAEARYLAFESIQPHQTFPVKGTALSAEALLGGSEKARDFQGGPLLLARLCPTDYHRFHFPDDGRLLESYSLHGKLHSVNPLALQYKGEIFATNERQVSILETKHFGKLAYIEVGALCVGKIVQTWPATAAGLKSEFKRGDEKGYFLFGASTVIVLGQAGKWKPSADLLEQTRLGRESLVRLGEGIASV